MTHPTLGLSAETATKATRVTMLQLNTGQMGSGQRPTIHFVKAT